LREANIRSYSPFLSAQRRVSARWATISTEVLNVELGELLLHLTGEAIDGAGAFYVETNATHARVSAGDLVDRLLTAPSDDHAIAALMESLGQRAPLSREPRASAPLHTTPGNWSEWCSRLSRAHAPLYHRDG
jgi:hypothetical protein